MTVDGTLENHRVRCQPYLLTLRMIARGDPGLLLTQLTVAEVKTCSRASARRTAWRAPAR